MSHAQRHSGRGEMLPVDLVRECLVQDGEDLLEVTTDELLTESWKQDLEEGSLDSVGVLEMVGEIEVGEFALDGFDLEAAHSF